MDTSVRLIVLGGGLLVVGVAVPFLMVIDILESTIPLNFLSVACSTIGLMIGFVGMAQYVRQRRRPRQ